MIAYNRNWLDNLLVQQQLEDAWNENFITKEEFAASRKMYSTGFYSNNIFIRIGLFILTIVIATFSMGLISLIFLSALNENIFGILLFFFGLICYAVLEIMVQRKHHYKSGVDDALIWASATCFIGGLNVATTISPTGNAILIFIIALYFLLRFTSALMGVIAVLVLFALVFLVYSKFGLFAKATISFLLLIIAAGTYLFTKKLSQQNAYRHYKNAFILIGVTTLICIYAVVNYCIVREARIELFGLNLKEGEGIPLGWLFWFFTFIIPFVYIFRGLQKKDVVLLRVGLLLAAAIVFTIRYYYAVLPLELVMVIGGLVLILIAYAVIQYLQKPKHGFTYTINTDKNLLDKINLEGIVIAETFTPVQPADSNTSFGNGSFGGGGASGDF